VADKMEKWAEKWSKTRQMGKRKFVIIYGLLLFGGLYAIMSLALDELFPQENSWLDRPIHAYIFFVFMGLLFGILNWYFAEKRYAKYLKK
jgi:hypothetical protein